MPDGMAAARPQPRQRMIEAARELALEGGYDAIQVQSVTALANVSSRTVYQHFASLDSLVVAALTEPSGKLFQRFAQPAVGSSTAATRVHQLIAELTASVTENRLLTVTLLRALFGGKPDVAAHVPQFADMLQTLFASAIAPDGPTRHDLEAARMLQSIWFSAIIVWATGPGTDIHLDDVMHEAARALLPAYDDR